MHFYSKQKTFELKGENYKRIIDNSKPKEIQDWYQKKSMYLVCERKIDKTLFSKKLVSDLKNGFDMLGPNLSLSAENNKFGYDYLISLAISLKCGCSAVFNNSKRAISTLLILQPS